MLELRDVRGKPTDSSQYLESALTDVGHIRNLTEKGRKTREGIIHFFRERDCVVLVRPCNEERDLKRMDKMDENELRPEFVRELNVIRDKIFRQCGPKKLKGVNLNTRMYVKMIQDYVDAINRGSVPVIESAWISVLKSELQSALSEAQDEYKETIQSKIDPKKNYDHDEVLKMLNESRDVALTVFGKVSHIQIHSGDIYDGYLMQLKKKIDSFEDRFIGENIIKANSHDAQLFTKLSNPITSKLNQRHYNKESSQELLHDINKMMQNFSKQAIGVKKTKTLCEKMKIFMPNVIQAYCQNVS